MKCLIEKLYLTIIFKDDIDILAALAADRSKQQELQKQKEEEAKIALEAKRLLEDKIEDNRRKAMELRLRNRTSDNSRWWALCLFGGLKLLLGII